MSNELKPCQKCANDKLRKYFCQYPPLYYIECPKCGNKSKSCVYEADAIKDWNLRPIEDALRAELASFATMSLDEFALWQHNNKKREQFGSELKGESNG